MPDHAPLRIASLPPSATVILAAIAELDRVVACTKYCAEVVPEIKSQVRIVADHCARPDQVIASVPYQERMVIELLEASVRFLGFAPKALADIYADIAIIAGAVGGQRSR
jgi:iron complex transport system substrate-binding protein